MVPIRIQIAVLLLLLLYLTIYCLSTPLTNIGSCPEESYRPIKGFNLIQSWQRLSVDVVQGSWEDMDLLLLLSREDMDLSLLLSWEDMDLSLLLPWEDMDLSLIVIPFLCPAQLLSWLELKCYSTSAGINITKPVQSQILNTGRNNRYHFYWHYPLQWT